MASSSSSRSTYVARREEKLQLLQDKRELELRKALLTAKITSADQLHVRQEDRANADDSDDAMAKQNEALREFNRVQQLSIYGANVALSNWLSGQELNALATYIHLTRDPLQRQQALMSIKDQVLNTAEQFLATRSRFLDPFCPYGKDDRSENDRGDFCSTGFDMIQFENVQSVKQVWDALLFYLANIEISVTEKLGHVTLREDCDVPDAGIAHHRLISFNSETGIQEEMNRAVFARIGDEYRLDQYPYILTAQFIDVDDLYPYSPSTCMRKDITAAISLTAHWRQRRHRGATTSFVACEDDEMVVVLRRASFIKLHQTDLPISQPSLRQKQDSITCWGEVMISAMRDQLYPKALV